MTDDIETSTIYFAEEILGVPLYPWQCNALVCFDQSPRKRVKVSLCTPNGAGKSERVVASMVLYWLSIFPQGKVVVTTKSGLQLDTQVCPAIDKHRAKFPGWKFIDRRIETPTGGLGIFFVTDEIGRAEGHHPVGDINTGPVLIIVDEAKSVPEEMFQALDRCNYQALLYVSSPGTMHGRFYESQIKRELGFHAFRAGLADCPHIPAEKIADIIATYGPDSPFTRSTLHGEFMVAEGEARFDEEGLKALVEMCDVEEALPEPLQAQRGDLAQQPGRSLQWLPHAAGWAWIREAPEPGCSYIGFCDPMTGAQSEGSLDRDTHAAGILRTHYIDAQGVEHDDEVVAVLHHDGGCRWDNDILADRFSSMLLHYGDAPAIVEANNSGTEVMRLLMLAGRTLWRREKPNHRVPGKKMIDVVGFQTNGATKSIWVGALGTAIRERTLVCRYRPAVRHFQQFILNEKGTGEAQNGCKDDFVTGVGLGLFARGSAKRLPAPMFVPQVNPYGYHQFRAPQQASGPWS